MRSIPVALTWELLYCGRWWLLCGTLGGLAFPLLLLGALTQDGALDGNDPSLIAVHLFLVQINMFMFGAAVMAAQRLPARLYPLPISNTELVVWSLIPAMGLMLLESQLNSVLINTLFHVNWPIWGPSLFAAVGLAAVQAVVWQTEKTAWVVLGLTAVSLISGLWLKSRYGALLLPMDHLWLELTTLEISTLLGSAVVAVYAATRGVARNRCGEMIPSLGIVDFFNRLFDRAPDDGPPFRSGLDAQAWFEWRKKGWAMPASVAFGLFLGMAGWLIFSRNVDELMKAMVVSGILLSLVATVGGMVTGNIGPDDMNYEMGHFLATRPLSNQELARTILKTAAKSLIYSWFIWAATVISLAAILAATGSLPPIKMPEDLREWYLPATVLGPWVIMTVGASIGLTGRSRVFVILSCVCSLLIFCSAIVSTWSRNALTPDARELLRNGVAIACGTAFVAGAAWVYFEARRRSLIRMPTVYIMTGAWFTLSLAVILEWRFNHSMPLAFNLFVVGLLALAAAPIAAAPLCISWNRTR